MSAKNYKIRLKKGDLVMVIRGKYKGQKARITAVHPKLKSVSLESINIVKRHQKRTQSHPQGGIIEVVKPMFVSKVALVEPQSQKPSRISIRYRADGSKERLYQKTKKPVVSKVITAKTKAKEKAK